MKIFQWNTRFMGDDYSFFAVAVDEKQAMDFILDSISTDNGRRDEARQAMKNGNLIVHGHGSSFAIHRFVAIDLS